MLGECLLEFFFKKCGGGFQVSKYPDFQVSKFQCFQVSKEGGSEGGREGGPMRGLGTGHVISGQ